MEGDLRLFDVQYPDARLFAFVVERAERNRGGGGGLAGRQVDPDGGP